MNERLTAALAELMAAISEQAAGAAVRRALSDQPEFALAVTIPQAAEKCGVSVSLMREWIRAGLVPTIRMTPESKPLVRVATLEHILRQHEQGGMVCDSPLAAPQTRGRQLRKAGE